MKSYISVLKYFSINNMLVVNLKLNIVVKHDREMAPTVAMIEEDIPPVEPTDPPVVGPTGN